MCWDDLDRPVYDVVRTLPLSHYAGGDGYSTARISVRRDYLEDYISRKNCIAVATFFDERFSLDDPEVRKLIQQSGFNVKQPGRQLCFKPMQLDFANQISQVSACATLLVPKSKPSSDPVSSCLIGSLRSRDGATKSLTSWSSPMYEMRSSASTSNDWSMTFLSKSDRFLTRADGP